MFTLRALERRRSLLAIYDATAVDFVGFTKRLQLIAADKTALV